MYLIQLRNFVYWLQTLVDIGHTMHMYTELVLQVSPLQIDQCSISFMANNSVKARFMTGHFP